MTKLANYRQRRAIALVIIFTAVVSGLVGMGASSWSDVVNLWQEFAQYDLNIAGTLRTDELALELLDKLEVKGRAPKTGYSRSLFSSAWQTLGGCSVRNIILKRDLTEVVVDDNCRVVSGQLHDQYTGQDIAFRYGATTSQEVQIDHIVAVSDAWQKGAQSWSGDKRYQFYNDPINLVAVGREVNQAKVDQDAASWLPPNKAFRCTYVSRQIEVKSKYGLWVTAAEKSAMQRVLQRCPEVNADTPR